MDLKQTFGEAKENIKLEKPSVIVLRLFEVITSWSKTVSIFIQYSRENMLTYLQENWKKKFMIALIHDLREQSYVDRQSYGDTPVVFKARQTSMAIQQSVLFYLGWRLAVDGGYDVGSESSAHNQLQKLLWFDAITKGKLKIDIYPDVPQVLKKWRSENIKVYLYSSCACGEIDGNKKLMNYTNLGDLSSFFDGYFDTNKMPQNSAESYDKMSKELNVAKNEILFLTRSMNEIEVAKSTGIKTVLVIREDGIAAFSVEDVSPFTAIGKLDEIVF
ncbi:enolase-phosphatase E1-like isoform X1 [Dinothrombium tinctorium]|uniref:Enolase-phosphatase E1-like isoform X1 n=1 Tax=Dinothrombium tinctorium TaxID=1965070 RepID=A0A3S4RBV1_9ACAR|nr:enolase-phosphatase E1-like isoform X1 [Dinothrombium tinctorium]RWS15956.1 enolase-phosphatase E1-like isoform X1 [Dinothrombium tinctorium]